MKIASLLLLAGTVFFAGSAPAGTFTFYSYTDPSLVFNRPTEAGDQLSDIGTASPYAAQLFTVSASGNYNLSVTANDPGSFDTFLHIYSTFNPGSPLAGVLGGNDDGVFGSPELGSALNGQPLLANTTYALVVSGFGNSDFGSFSATINGPGSISPVPEPSTFALAALGLVTVFLLRRRFVAASI